MKKAPEELRASADTLEKVSAKLGDRARELRAQADLEQADLEEDPIHVHLVFPRKLEGAPGLLKGTGFYVENAISAIVDGDVEKDPTLEFEVRTPGGAPSVDVPGRFRTRAAAQAALDEYNRRHYGSGVAYPRSVRVVSA